MNIAIIGTGYVGLVTGACFAGMGHRVVCVDKNRGKIAKLNRGICPLHEPGLQQLIKKTAFAGLLTFTVHGASAVNESEIIFNCVGTPLNRFGLPDLDETYNTASLFARNLNAPKIFVNKSTVPVGTGEKCEKLILKNLDKNKKMNFSVVSNPEFLRQGTAIKDFQKPERIIIGASDKNSAKTIKNLYSPLIKKGIPVLVTDVKTAELVKYAANAFIATKISFINEIAGYCRKTGINIREISRGIGLDSRIGEKYLRAGIGYGGGCLSKDIKSLISIGRKDHYRFGILEEVSKINSRLRKTVEKMIEQHEKPEQAFKTVITIWGLSYKPLTDDLRDSPAMEIAAALAKNGYNLRLHDPEALKNAKKQLPASKNIKYFTNQYLAAKGADLLLVLTEWNDYKKPDFTALSAKMRKKQILDGRNIINPKTAKALGFKYFGI